MPSGNLAQPDAWNTSSNFLINIGNSATFSATAGQLNSPGSGSQVMLLSSDGSSASYIRQVIQDLELDSSTLGTATIAVGFSSLLTPASRVVLRFVAAGTSSVLASRQLLRSQVLLNTLVDMSLQLDGRTISSTFYGVPVVLEVLIPPELGAVFVDNVRVTGMPATFTTLAPMSTINSATTNAAARFTETVLVRNANFEEDDLITGGEIFITRAAGFVIAGDAGTLLPVTTAFARRADGSLTAPASGFQTAYMKPDSALITTLPRKLIAGDTYTFKLAVGRRADRVFAAVDILSIQLRVETQVLQLAALPNVSQAVGLGGHVDLTFSYTVPAASPYLGQEPVIEILADGGVATAQITVDNLRVTVQTRTTQASLVPTPGPARASALRYDGKPGALGSSLLRCRAHPLN